MARGRGLLRSGLKASTALVLVLSVSACGMFGNRDEEVALEDQEAQPIFQQAEARLENGRPDDAAELFLEVERLHPYSEWAQRALIMAAYSFHQDEDYENSRAAAQRFLDFYPAAEDAAYAQYLLALSYYDQIDQIGRDQG